MTFKALGAYLLSALVFACSVFLWIELQSLGFPDGFLTELDRAREPLYLTMLSASIFISFYLSYIGITDSKREKSRALLYALLLYLLLMIAMLFVDASFQSRFAHGGGG